LILTGIALSRLMKRAPSMYHTLVFLTLTLPAVGSPAIKPSEGFQVVWQGEGGHFVEVAEKPSRRSVTVTLQAHHFDVKTRQGLQLAKAAMDQATLQVTMNLQRLPQYTGKRITESHRGDHVARQVLTRTVEFMIVDEKAIAAAEEAERKRREQAEEKERKQARERDERERKQKERAEDERKNREKKTEPRAANTRSLQVRIASVSSESDPTTQLLNRCLRSEKASATDNSLRLAWDVDTRNWPADTSRPLSVIMLDRDGRSLASFTSPEWFTTDKTALGTASRTTGLPSGSKPVLLKSAGNMLTYEVDPRVLPRVVLVEVGFATP
jgi:hypothetical protein